MRVDLLTREYPPEIYGGAGVHVAELVRALRRDIDVQVRCFGGPRDEAGTTAYATPAEFASANAALSTMAVDLLMAQDAAGADLVHSHTWYANFAGFTAKQLHGVPHVVTAHSLEPLRPWKAEQLGGGYRVSSWVERTAFEDADHLVHYNNGIAYRDRGMWYMAAREWEAAARKKPREANYLHALGLAYARLKRFEHARATLDQALRAAPDHPKIKESRALVDRMAAQAAK